MEEKVELPNALAKFAIVGIFGAKFKETYENERTILMIILISFLL
jgi:hypothetical protein